MNIGVLSQMYSKAERNYVMMTKWLLDRKFGCLFSFESQLGGQHF